MSENEKRDFGGDDFWNLDEYAKKKAPKAPVKQFSKSATQAVEIGGVDKNGGSPVSFSDSRLSTKDSDSTITRFIPPHKDSVFAKKYVLFEYEPQNPLIKSIKICADRPDEKLFPETNLFIRERRALLNRKASECPHATYYSYSPRYSQMSRAQLSYYLWWRENTRNGIFLKADESYIILYAYELAATGEGEDKQAALDMLCALLKNYTEKDINVVFRMMIRDIICDFCLIHGLSAPLEQLSGVGRILTANAFLPEFFIDLSENNRSLAMDLGLSAISMYDYRKSKFYTPENKETFKKAMNGALSAMIRDENAFGAITSFTNGMYGCVTSERRPFARMINIVNRSIRFEITYYQIANIQSAVTDAMRYSENKLREHMGIKNKLHIMAINPDVRSALDAFFNENYPPMPVVDRRRRDSRIAEEEPHEYDRFYDVPKAEFSAERALEIERESWSTTKILTEAFGDEGEVKFEESTTLNAPELIIEPISEPVSTKESTVEESFEIAAQSQSAGGLFEKIKSELGEIAELITLCKSPSPTEQRRFASAHGLTLDEIADRINECAADVFGDIILEDVGSAYGILEDYIDQF